MTTPAGLRRHLSASVLWRLGVGRAQIIRPGRRGLRIDGGAEPRHPGDIGRRLRIDLERRRRIRRPAIGENAARHCRPDAARRIARRRAPRRSARRCGRISEPPSPLDHLEIDMVVPRIDRGDHRLLAVLADDRRGIGGQRGQPDHRFVGGERDAARGREPDPQAGKAAGAGGDRDAVERGERRSPDCFMTRAISGISASAWPRFIGCDSCAISLPASVSSTAAAQASSAVSMARISIDFIRVYNRHRI